jgi:hypothetical protein
MDFTIDLSQVKPVVVTPTSKKKKNKSSTPSQSPTLLSPPESPRLKERVVTQMADLPVTRLITEEPKRPQISFHYQSELEKLITSFIDRFGGSRNKLSVGVIDALRELEAFRRVSPTDGFKTMYDSIILDYGGRATLDVPFEEMLEKVKKLGSMVFIFTEAGESASEKVVPVNPVMMYGSVLDKVVNLRRADQSGESAKMFLTNMIHDPEIANFYLKNLEELDRYVYRSPKDLAALTKDSAKVNVSEFAMNAGVPDRFFAHGARIKVPPMLNATVRYSFLASTEDNDSIIAQVPIVIPSDLMNIRQYLLDGTRGEQTITQLRSVSDTLLTVKELVEVNIANKIRHATYYPMFRAEYKWKEADLVFISFVEGVMNSGVREIEADTASQLNPQEAREAIRSLRLRASEVFRCANENMLSNGSMAGQFGRLKSCLLVILEKEYEFQNVIGRTLWPSPDVTLEQMADSLRRIGTLRKEMFQFIGDHLVQLLLKSFPLTFHPSFTIQSNYSATIENWQKENPEAPAYFLQLNEDASAGALYPPSTTRGVSFPGEILTTDLLLGILDDPSIKYQHITSLIEDSSGVWSYFRLAFLKPKFEVETRANFGKKTRNYFPSVCGGQIAAGLLFNASHHKYVYPWTADDARSKDCHSLLGFSPYDGGMNRYVTWVTTCELVKANFCTSDDERLWNSIINFLYDRRMSDSEVTSSIKRTVAQNQEVNTVHEITIDNTSLLIGGVSVPVAPGSSRYDCLGSHWVVYSDNLYIVWEVKVSGSRCPVIENNTMNNPRVYRFTASLDGSKMEACVNKHHAESWSKMVLLNYELQTGKTCPGNWKRYFTIFHPSCSFGQYVIYGKEQFINPGQGSGIQGTAQFNSAAMGFFAKLWHLIGGMWLVPRKWEEVVPKTDYSGSNYVWDWPQSAKDAMDIAGIKLTIETVENLTPLIYPSNYAGFNPNVLNLDLLGYEAVRATAFEGEESALWWPRLKRDRLLRVVCFTDVDKSGSQSSALNTKQWMLESAKLSSLWILGAWSDPVLKDSCILHKNYLMGLWESKFKSLDAGSLSPDDVASALYSLVGARVGVTNNLSAATLESTGFRLMRVSSLYRLYFGEVATKDWVNKLSFTTEGQDLYKLFNSDLSFGNIKAAVGQLAADKADYADTPNPNSLDKFGKRKFPSLFDPDPLKSFAKDHNNPNRAERVSQCIEKLYEVINFFGEAVVGLPKTARLLNIACTAVKKRTQYTETTRSEDKLRVYQRYFYNFWLAFASDRFGIYAHLVPPDIKRNELELDKVLKALSLRVIFTPGPLQTSIFGATCALFLGRPYREALTASLETVQRFAAVDNPLFSAVFVPLKDQVLSSEAAFKSGKEKGKKKLLEAAMLQAEERMKAQGPMVFPETVLNFESPSLPELRFSEGMREAATKRVREGISAAKRTEELETEEGDETEYLAKIREFETSMDELTPPLKKQQFMPESSFVSPGVIPTVLQPLKPVPRMTFETKEPEVRENVVRAVVEDLRGEEDLPESVTREPDDEGEFSGNDEEFTEEGVPVDDYDFEVEDDSFYQSVINKTKSVTDLGKRQNEGEGSGSKE